MAFATDTPVATFDLVDSDPRHSAQSLTLDADHGLGELGNHLLLLAAIEDSLMTLTCTSGMMSSFCARIGCWDQYPRAAATGLRGSCHTLASVLQARLQ